MQLAETRPRTAMLLAKCTGSGADPPGLEHGCRRPVIERAGRPICQDAGENLIKCRRGQTGISTPLDVDDELGFRHVARALLRASRSWRRWSLRPASLRASDLQRGAAFLKSKRSCRALSDPPATPVTQPG